MAKQVINDIEPDVFEPVENEQTELAKIMQEGDPETQLAILEKKAALAPRFTQAINTILVGCTYPEDWIEHGDTVCLKSAAAERIARNFDIVFYNVKNTKETFTDANGPGYRYIFEGEARMANRVIFAQGIYSTRDNFLGKKSGELRPVEDINENHIRSAAYHIFMGNGVKALLGLRGIPKARFDELMSRTGQDATKKNKVTYNNGSQGGTSQDDTAMQRDLSKILLDMANALQMITVDDKGHYGVEQTSEISDPMEVAKASCKAITSYYDKKNSKMVDGIESIKALKGKRLEIAVENARKLQGGAS